MDLQIYVNSRILYNANYKGKQGNIMSVQSVSHFEIETFDGARKIRDLVIWEKLGHLSLQDVIAQWLSTLSRSTELNYRSGINMLSKFGLLDLDMSLQAFSLVNHDAILDRIKQLPAKETTNQARAALFISLTRFLARKFKGVFTKVIPATGGNERTFFKVHSKVVTEAMNRSQWVSFFAELERINYRDCLIGKVALQGGKRISEVLTLTTDKIDYSKNEITFKQSKSKGTICNTVITYSDEIISQLKSYIGDRDGYVFVSRNNKIVGVDQVQNTFARAGREANIPFKVTPHVLRASCVTYLKQQGYSDSDICKITGHASGEMVRAYDKSDIAQNPSKTINLI